MEEVYTPKYTLAGATAKLVAGTWTQTPLGVVLHGSRSGRADYTTAQEFAGTVAYAMNGTDGINMWHVTIGDDDVAVHLYPDQWGWHARKYSERWLGAEFAQPTVGHAISDAQIRAFVWWFYNIARKRWPDLEPHFVFHSEIMPGILDGKTDPFPNGSAELVELRQRILGMLRGV